MRQELLAKAYSWGNQKHPAANNYRHAAFANSVAYLVTGASGGYGGPSIREHCVSWCLAGDGYNTNFAGMTIQFPDDRIPRPGKWEFEQACEFAAPIVYGRLPAFAARVAANEHCFDDDPADLDELRR